MRRKLLVLSAILEAATGLSLVFLPSVPVSILLELTPDTPGSLVLAHVAGAALITIGIACWLARGDAAGKAMVTALLVYNLAVTVVLVHAAIVLNVCGIGLWPASAGHTALAVWCIICLFSKKA